MQGPVTSFPTAQLRYATAMAAPLILLGGTFDPPHIGHLILAACAAHQFSGQVTFLPAGDPWRKTASPALSVGVSAAHHRVEMTRLAIAGNPAFELDGRETRRHGPTYTADTLEELHMAGHAEIVLILGADALDDLPNWHQPDRIRSLATVAVAPRAGAAARITAPYVAVDMPPVAISATDIRDRIRAGKPTRYMVPADVEGYIAAQRLYRD